MLNKILQARELRSKGIMELATKDTCCVLCIKANMPTGYKNSNQANVAITLAFNHLSKVLQISSKRKYKSCDGSFILLTTNIDSVQAKKQAMIIEDMPFGRLIDIDVYNGNGVAISRRNLNIAPRNCVVCGDIAVVCTRSQRHSQADVYDAMSKILQDYLSAKVSELLKDSFLAELDCDNKFGLVSKTTNGSHKDMNYQIMSNSIEEITPYLTSIFVSKWTKNISWKEAQEIGIQAEYAMNRATKGVNTYKGAIFIVGSMLFCLAGNLANKGKKGDIYGTCKKMFASCEIATSASFGSKAYNYGFGGIRKEALEGFPTVKLLERFLINKQLSEENILKALQLSVRNTDDSVLFKRCLSDYNKYDFFKKLIGSCDVTDKKSLQGINKQCVDSNVSIGGSADNLISAILLTKLLVMFK